MDKRTVNIAVIVSGIDEEYQNTILRGIHDFGAMYNMNICHFMAYGGILKNQSYDVGENNIYELVNYSKFDGVILLANTISNPDAAERIIERVRAADIPAVSIDRYLEGFYYVGIDNYSAMRGMVKHIVEHHGIRLINYISGPDDNPESMLRVKAYRDVLEEYDIPIIEERIFHGLFRGEDGREAVKEFLSSDLKFPEAIICANDAMALSAVIELEKYGKNVPKDVLVTGFDSIYAAQNYAPEITSVKRPLRRSGALACKVILDHLSGSRGKEIHILPTEYVFAESCGCPNMIIDDIASFKKSNYRTIETYNIYTPLINRMSCQFEECQTLEENTAVLKEQIGEIKCEKFLLCICDDWNIEESLNGKEFTVNGYTETVKPVITYVNGEFIDCPPFSVRDMMPEIFKASMKGSRYYFTPVHFRDHCIGYCVVCNCAFPMESVLYHTWVMNISNSIENVRKILCLDKMVHRMDLLSITDPLVKIYNRNGLNKLSKPIYEDCIKNGKDIMIMFIDMDNLKKINDKYGHEEGDFSLHAIADALKYVTDENKRQIPARFGGDEFIILAAEMTNADAEAMSDGIADYLEKLNRVSGKPYRINVSTGFYISKADSERSLNKLISAADQIMYENKKRKKAIEENKK